MLTNKSLDLSSKKKYSKKKKHESFNSSSEWEETDNKRG
jgi:hypothetical protein